MKIVGGILPKVLLGGAGLIVASAATPSLVSTTSGGKNQQIDKLEGYGVFGEAIDPIRYPRIQGGCYFFGFTNNQTAWLDGSYSFRRNKDKHRVGVFTNKRHKGSCTASDGLDKVRKEYGLNMRTPEALGEPHNIPDDTNVMLMLGFENTASDLNTNQSRVMFCIEYNAHKINGVVEGEAWNPDGALGKKCDVDWNIDRKVIEKLGEEKREDKYGTFYERSKVYITSVDKWAWVNIRE